VTDYPIRILGELYHLWLPPELKGPAAAMPACCMPVSERIPVHPSPLARVWRITRPAGRFVDVDRLCAGHHAEIVRWGERRGLASHAKAWEVRAWDAERAVWRKVRCTDPAKAAIVLTEPFLAKRRVVPVSWFVATPALEGWHRDRVLPDATPGVLSLKYALDVLDCDGAFRRRDDGGRTVALFAERLSRWTVREIGDRAPRGPYGQTGQRCVGAHVDAWC
jgi:hypothetical protein